MAQRPSYAGSAPIGRPGLANRFKDTEQSTTATVYNRFSEDGTTAKIPVDARGDAQLVDRLNQWPRENRPYWLLNAEKIEAQRGGSGGSSNSQIGSQGIQQTQNQMQNQPTQQELASRNNIAMNEWETGLAFSGPSEPSETRTIRPVAQRSSFLPSSNFNR